MAATTMLFLLFSTIPIILATNAPSSSSLFVIRLLYTQSLAYPGFDPNSTIENIANIIEQTSRDRILYLNYAAAIKNYGMEYKEQRDDSGVTTHVSPVLGNPAKRSAFVADIKIGEPGVQVFPIIDTGSSLLWLKDRSIIRNTDASYSSTKSSTFKPLPCSPEFCTWEISGTCSKDSKCLYHLTYHSFNQAGILAYESLRMETHLGNVLLTDIILGASRRELNNTIFESDGILGLARGDLSLTMQLASRYGSARFSYCLGKMGREKISDHSHLSFGTSSSLYGASTPFSYGLHYDVTLDSISVMEGGEEMILPIDSKSNFRAYYGTVIDTGSPLSYIVQDALDALVNEVHRAMSSLGFKSAWMTGPDLCYRAQLESVIGFPTFIYRFDRGAKLILGVESLFYQYNQKTICLSVKSSNSQSQFGYGVYNLIGSFAQQNQNIGYDLDKKLVHMQRMDCEDIFK
ncbi:hypothetical protein REPUB_Repub12eG0148600 [Reevesia pubescens]